MTLSGVDKFLTVNALKLGHPENHLYEQCLADLRESLDPADFERSRTQGQTLTARALVEYAVKRAV